MHSRIFQLSTKGKISKDDYINEEGLNNPESSGSWFINSIADYVTESNDRKDDIKWLLDTIESYGIEFNEQEEYIIFKKGFIENYFKERYNMFKEEVENLTLKNFIDFFQACKLKSLIMEKYTFYINCGRLGLVSMDTFVRALEEDVKYYIGGTLDYHC